MKLAFFTITAFLAAPLALADDYTVGDMTVIHPMIYEIAENTRVAAGYMTLDNDAASTDTLISVRSDFASRIELHLSETDENGVARMTEQENGIPVAANGTVTLRPGGLHIMFMGLDGTSLSEGNRINATLMFENAGAIDVTFKVEARGSDDHEPMDHDD